MTVKQIGLPVNSMQLEELQYLPDDGFFDNDMFQSMQSSSSGKMQPYFQTQPSLLLILEPNVAAGPMYDPLIGWYFTAQPESQSIPELSNTASAFPIMFEEHTAESLIDPLLLQSGYQTPELLTPALQPVERPSSMMPDNLTNMFESLAEVSQGTEEIASPSDPSVSKQSATKDTDRKAKCLPSFQACICTNNAAHIKRPRNAFILYRSAQTSGIISKSLGGHNDHQDVFKIAGQKWRHERPEIV